MPDYLAILRLSDSIVEPLSTMENTWNSGELVCVPETLQEFIDDSSRRSQRTQNTVMTTASLNRLR